MHTVYQLTFVDGSKESLIVHDKEIYLHNNPQVQTNQGCASSHSALAVAIGYIHWNYKKVASVSGGDLELLKKAIKHSELVRTLPTEIVMCDSFGYYKSIRMAGSPTIPDKVKLEIPRIAFKLFFMKEFNNFE